jgi:carbon storage regulator
MLVLTRKIGETIRIGEQVTVRVLGVRGGQVSLGFVAPSDVRIYREEIFQAIEKQNQESILPSSDSLAGAADAWEEFGNGKHG